MLNLCGVSMSTRARGLPAGGTDFVHLTFQACPKLCQPAFEKNVLSMRTLMITIEKNRGILR